MQLIQLWKRKIMEKTKYNQKNNARREREEGLEAKGIGVLYIDIYNLYDQSSNYHVMSLYFIFSYSRIIHDYV